MALSAIRNLNGDEMKSKIPAKFGLLFHKPISKIQDRLYLGDMIDADNKTLLKRLKISHILNMAKEAPCFHPKDFEYMHVKGNDVEGYNIGQHFKQITNFIHIALSQGTGIFVHCVYGISRGSTATIAYLMRFEKMIYSQARRKVERGRPHIYPNFGFVRHLKEWGKKLEMMKNRKRTKNLKEKKSFYDTDYIGGSKRGRKRINKIKSNYRRSQNANLGYKSKSRALRMYNGKRGLTQSLRPSKHNFISNTSKNIDQALKIGNLSISEEKSCDAKNEFEPSNHVTKHNLDWLNNPKKTRKYKNSEPSHLTTSKTNNKSSTLSKILKPMLKNLNLVKNEWRRKSLDRDPLKIARYSPKKGKIKKRKFLSDRFKKPKIRKNGLYVCKSCKCKLAFWRNVITHEPDSVSKCDSLFLNKMNWMKADYLGYKKLLVCPNPKCRAVLGMMSSSGVKCSCGFLETPGFQLKKKMIKETKVEE